MRDIDPHIFPVGVQSRRARLADFIAHRSSGLKFRLHDWLRTLETAELLKIEADAQCCCFHDELPDAISAVDVVDLVDAALMAYAAERSFEISQDDARDCLDDLLIGLSVAACIERLERVGWVTSTNRVGILLECPKPFRVTHKGLQEGIWSEEPLTLWLLGMSLELH